MIKKIDTHEGHQEEIIRKGDLTRQKFEKQMKSYIFSEFDKIDSQKKVGKIKEIDDI